MEHGESELVAASEVQLGDLLGRASGRRGEPMGWQRITNVYSLGESTHFQVETTPGGGREWVRRSRYGQVRVRRYIEREAGVW